MSRPLTFNPDGNLIDPLFVRPTLKNLFAAVTKCWPTPAPCISLCDDINMTYTDTLAIIV